MNSLCKNSLREISNHAYSADISTDRVQPLVCSPSNDGAQERRSGWLVNLFSKGKNYLVRKYNQRIDRQAFNYLLTLDDSMLKDVGVTRQDVVYASNQPLSTDASAIVNEIARRR